MPNYHVIAVGGVCWDYVGIVEEYPALDEKALLTDFVQMGGGLSGTAMSAVAALGGTAKLFGRLGDDDFGEKTVEASRREGVDTSGLQIVRGATSQLAICIAHRGTGRRTIFWRPGSYERLREGELDLAGVTDCRTLLVDHHHIRAATEAALYARRKGIPVVGDIERVQPGAEEFLAAVDYPIVPARFLREFTGGDNLTEGAAALRKLGARVVIVTEGEAGATAFVGDEQLRQPAYAIEPIVDTTGAGDVFHGAFAYGLALGYDLKHNLRFASATAALSCRGLGGRGALPTMEDVRGLIG